MSGAAVALPRQGSRRRGTVRRRRWLALLLVFAAALGGLYWFWFRDSSLVAVSTVQVSGLRQSGDSAEVRAALTAAAKKMTTLHVQPALLRDAVKPFPLVESVSASASFPSRLSIDVTERRPASLIDAPGGPIAVADDGTILRGLAASDLQLPRLPLSKPPGHPQLHGAMLQQALVLGAMPKPFAGAVLHTYRGDAGVTAKLAGGIELRFGDARDAAAKWRAAGAVLADPGLGPLDYVDLRVAGRPAVGGIGHDPPPLNAP